MKKDKSFYLTDPWLDPFVQIINDRFKKCTETESLLTGGKSLCDFALGHHYYGLHRDNGDWVLREWAPNATAIFITGPFSGWKESETYRMKRLNEEGNWEIRLPGELLKHEDIFKLSVHWDGGSGERLPSYANRVVQDDKTKIFSASVWSPEKQYKWKHNDFRPDPGVPVIYESHVGMATDEEKTGTFREFTRNVLPYVAKAGYNTVQLMAIQEHPFYGSFGYHVANFFAPSSRFGTPEEL